MKRQTSGPADSQRCRVWRYLEFARCTPVWTKCNGGAQKVQYNFRALQQMQLLTQYNVLSVTYIFHKNIILQCENWF